MPSSAIDSEMACYVHELRDFVRRTIATFQGSWDARPIVNNLLLAKRRLPSESGLLISVFLYPSESDSEILKSCMHRRTRSSESCFFFCGGRRF